MKVGVGAVSLTATPLPPAPPAPAAEETPTTPVSDGVASPVAHKLIHRLSTGGATLDVRLPAAGSLVVSDARRKAAVASVFSASSPPHDAAAAPKPILIRTASVAVDRPQTVHVRLRPTAAASRLLAKRGRVPFRLQLDLHLRPRRGLDRDLQGRPGEAAQAGSEMTSRSEPS